MDRRRLKKVHASQEGDPRVFPPKRTESKREQHILNELKMLSLLICLALGIIVLIARPWQRGFALERQEKVFVELKKLFKPESPAKTVTPPKKDEQPVPEKKPKKEAEVERRGRRDDVAPRRHRSVLAERPHESGITVTQDREDIPGRPSERAQTVEPRPVEQTHQQEARASESNVVRNLPPAYYQRIADRMLTLEAIGTDYQCHDFSYSYCRRSVTITYGGRTYRLSALAVLPLPDDNTLRNLLDFFIRTFDERFR